MNILSVIVIIFSYIIYVQTCMPDVFTQKLKSPMFKGIQALKFDAYGTMNLLHLSISFSSIFN